VFECSAPSFPQQIAYACIPQFADARKWNREPCQSDSDCQWTLPELRAESSMGEIMAMLARAGMMDDDSDDDIEPGLHREDLPEACRHRDAASHLFYICIHTMCNCGAPNPLSRSQPPAIDATKLYNSMPILRLRDHADITVASLATRIRNYI
jgi:hypothetical protein